MTTTHPRYGYYGHHKCATTWVRHLVDHICDYVGIKAETLHSADQLDGDLKQHCMANAVEFVCYTNALSEHVQTLGKIPAFHVIRDPRDIIISAYFSHRNSHPTKCWGDLLEYRERLQHLDTESGIIAELDYSKWVLRGLRQWDYHQDHILEMRFEHLVTNPYEFAMSAFSHLGLIDERPFSARGWLRDGKAAFAKRTGISRLSPTRIPSRHLLALVHDSSFSKITAGRQRGDEDQSSHFRKGISGDWRNYFTKKVEREFKDRYAGLLQELGYEQNNDWHADSAMAAQS